MFINTLDQKEINIGLDQLIDQDFKALKTPSGHSKKLAVLCHAASINKEGRHITQILHQAGLEINCYFGPEHGIWGTAQDMEAVDQTEREYYSQKPVYSLYGHDIETLKPKTEQLQGVDCFLIDLQDIGARYYTYIYTATLCMAKCAELGIEVIVLDRPNPLGGEAIEGNMTKEGYLSFVGLWPLPTRHGMTMGEVLTYFNHTQSIHAKLRVIRMSGWQRSDLQIDHSFQMGQPSPNMPSFQAMLVYPGMCLIEGTEMSEARGTTRPFEWVGADYIEPFSLSESLNALSLEGVYFRPIYYKPTFHKFAHQNIGGIELRVTEPRVFKPLKTGLFFLATVRKHYGDALKWREKAYEFVADVLAIDLLFGTNQGRLCIDAQGDVEGLWRDWQNEAEGFREIRKPYLLY
jgi:uncharacterized protein YbbC (DUF1343 family)